MRAKDNYWVELAKLELYEGINNASKNDENCSQLYQKIQKREELRKQEGKKKWKKDTERSQLKM